MGKGKAEIEQDTGWRRSVSAWCGVGHAAVVGLLWPWKDCLGLGEDKMFGQVKKLMKEETSDAERSYLIAPREKEGSIS